MCVLFQVLLTLGASSNVVDIFNASSGLWSVAALEGPRTFLAAVSLIEHGLVFLAGGFDGLASERVDLFDASSGNWIYNYRNLSLPRFGLAATSLPGQGLVLFAGGSGMSKLFTSLCEFGNFLWNFFDML
jgi:hypothetical protein